jgi:hypothetical protein
MTQINRLVGLSGLVFALTGFAIAQTYGGGTGGGTSGGTTGGGTMGGTTAGSASAGAGTPAGGPATVYNFHNNYHLGFDRPESWGLKYFASASMLSGLPMVESPEGHRVGSVTVGFESDWLPSLDAGQRQIGFKGMVPEDLNKAPIFARILVRVGLPAKFSAVVAAPPPFEVFGVTSHLLALALERPLVERPQWTIGWRGYGQVGSVKGAFTCPKGVLAFDPGSPQNPTECVGESSDVATLRYVGMEFQFAHRIPSMPKLVPHVAAGGNWIDGAFHVNAQVADGLDRTRLWTRGGTFTGSGGLTYLLTRQAQFAVDAFYTPLWVQRSATAPRTNDGLFNVRAMISYTFR